MCLFIWNADRKREKERERDIGKSTDTLKDRDNVVTRLFFFFCHVNTFSSSSSSLRHGELTGNGKEAIACEAVCVCVCVSVCVRFVPKQVKTTQSSLGLCISTFVFKRKKT